MAPTTSPTILNTGAPPSPSPKTTPLIRYDSAAANATSPPPTPSPQEPSTSPAPITSGEAERTFPPPATGNPSPTAATPHEKPLVVSPLPASTPTYTPLSTTTP